MNKAKSKEFDKLMESSQELISEGKYEQAIGRLNKAAEILKAEKNDSPEAWAWIYDGRRYALYEQGKVDEALGECRKAIEHLGNATLFPYLAEDSHVRGTLRATHNMLAWTLTERAKTEAECLVALGHINTCMSTTSPIDGSDQLDMFFETQAVTLLRMTELAAEPADYHAQLFSLLSRLMKKRHSCLHQNEKLTAIIETDEFRAYMAEDPEVKLYTPPEGETVEEALERYSRALDFVATHHRTLSDYFKVAPKEPLDETQIAKHEQFIGITLPPALREFALRHGAFRIGDYESKLGVLPRWSEEKIAGHGLVNFIDYCWGGRPEFEEFYTQEHLDHVNKSFIAFGIADIDDNRHEYLFFDREGNFASIFMDQDSFDWFQEDFNPLLKTNTIPSPQTFEQVFSTQISRVIRNILDLVHDR